MLRKLIIVIISCILMLSISSCSYKESNTLETEEKVTIRDESEKIQRVESAVNDYLKSYVKGDYITAYGLLAEKEKEVISLEEYSPREVLIGDKDADSVVSKLLDFDKEFSSHTIDEIISEENYYNIEATLISVDTNKMFNELPKNGILTDWASSINILNAINSKEQFSFLETIINIKAVKEGEEIKIDLGYYDNYKKTEEELNGYLQYIKILDEEVSIYSDSAYISGYMQNMGEENIDSLVLKIKYLDDEENILYEETSFTWTDGYKNEVTMKPNYISNFIFTVPRNIMSDWNEDYILEIVGMNKAYDDNSFEEIDQGILNNISIESNIESYSDSSFVSGSIINSNSKTIDGVIIKVEYLDANDKPILEDFRIVYLKNNNYSTMIGPNEEGEFLFMAPDAVHRYWDKKVNINIISIDQI